MDASVFDFFEEHPNRENRYENSRPASHSEGCDFGYEYDFEYESPESDSPRTNNSSPSPFKIENIGQQLTPDYSSSSDSDNDESLYSPSSSESSEDDADSSDSIRSVFGSDAPADDSPEMFSPVQMSPVGVERQLFGFQSPMEGQRLENRTKNDKFSELKSDVSSLSSKNSNVSTDRPTTVYIDDKETVQPRPSPSTKLITFYPIKTRKATPITNGRRAIPEKGNNIKNLPSNGKTFSAPQRSKPEAVEGPIVKTITLAGNSGIRNLKGNQPCKLTPYVRLPGIPIRLKSEAFFQNGEIEIRIFREGRKWLDHEQLNVNVVIVDKDKTSSQRKVPQRKRKGPSTKSKKKKGNGKPVDRDVVENRANWPGFNTALSKEANKRYMNRLGI